jgi:polyisoprenoid-binding protein YceI
MKQLSFLLLISFSTVAQGKLELDQLFPVDVGHSYIEFSATYMGYAHVKGRFADFAGFVRYDQNDPSATSATISIKTESIDTDLDFRDKDLKSANWFDAEKYPLILFTSKKQIHGKEGFDLVGDLTIKGITHEVTLKMAAPSGVMKDVRGDLQVIFSGSAKIDRTAFGIEGKNWSAVKEGMTAVSSDVVIELSILGKQLQVSNLQNMVKFTKGAARIYKAVKDAGLDAGLAEFKTFVDDKSADVNMLGMTGRVLRAEGRLDQAKAIYEANLKSFPDSWEVYYALGELALLESDAKGAKSYFEEAARKDPGNVRVIEILRHL